MANPYNACSLSGRLTTAPRFTKRKSDQVEFEALFTIAVQRNYKNRKGEYLSDFIPCRYTGENRMAFAHRLKLGDSVNLFGSIKSEMYYKQADGDPKNLEKHYRIFFEVESIQWTVTTTRKSENQKDNSSEPKQAGSKQVNQKPVEPMQNSFGKDDSLPFD